GMGIMGSRMAGHLLAAGYPLIVHNRTRAKADDLIAQGATWAETPAAMAAQADIIFTMIAHPEAVSTAALGADGFLDHMRAGALWIQSSTVNPSFVHKMAAEAQARSIRFLDAPVAGSKTQADNADLVFIIGGSEADVEATRPLLEVMSGRVAHVGAVGMGTSMKVILNMLLATTMAAFAEGVALGEALGFDKATLLNVLVGSAVAPPYVAGKRQKLESGDYPADFPLRWMQKDLHMVTLAAYEAGVALPVANTAKEIYQLGIRAGLGEDDFSAIYRLIAANQDAVDQQD
ncbi:MAG: NAD(P)-dependent oxidoreductase, partial [Chloroflexi bacterium]|nr:NAD(P)-dependent oxidoreductase [Chloroflexota bacterium]